MIQKLGHLLKIKLMQDWETQDLSRECNSTCIISLLSWHFSSISSPCHCVAADSTVGWCRRQAATCYLCDSLLLHLPAISFTRRTQRAQKFMLIPLDFTSSLQAALTDRVHWSRAKKVNPKKVTHLQTQPIVFDETHKPANWAQVYAVHQVSLLPFYMHHSWIWEVFLLFHLKAAQTEMS